MLEDRSDALAESGLELGGVFPSFRSKTSVSVSFRGVGVLTLTADAGTPEGSAAEMMGNLFSKRPDQWMTAFPWDGLKRA
jgi:hypothetical protein